MAIHPFRFGDDAAQMGARGIQFVYQRSGRHRRGRHPISDVDPEPGETLAQAVARVRIKFDLADVTVEFEVPFVVFEPPQADELDVEAAHRPIDIGGVRLAVDPVRPRRAEQLRPVRQDDVEGAQAVGRLVFAR